MSPNDNSWENALRYEATAAPQQDVDPVLAAALSRAISSEQLKNPEKKQLTLSPAEMMQAYGESIDAMRRLGALEEQHDTDPALEEKIAASALKITMQYELEKKDADLAV